MLFVAHNSFAEKNTQSFYMDSLGSHRSAHLRLTLSSSVALKTSSFNFSRLWDYFPHNSVIGGNAQHGEYADAPWVLVRGSSSRPPKPYRKACPSIWGWAQNSVPSLVKPARRMPIACRRSEFLGKRKKYMPSVKARSVQRSLPRHRVDGICRKIHQSANIYSNQGQGVRQISSAELAPTEQLWYRPAVRIARERPRSTVR